MRARSPCWSLIRTPFRLGRCHRPVADCGQVDKVVRQLADERRQLHHYLDALFHHDSQLASSYSDLQARSGR